LLSYPTTDCTPNGGRASGVAILCRPGSAPLSCAIWSFSIGSRRSAIAFSIAS
jgi:hypothetical protein